jgi:hypothetical protein
MNDQQRDQSYAAIIEDARWEHDRAEELKRELFASKRIDQDYLTTLAGEIKAAEQLLGRVAAAQHDQTRAGARQLEVAGHLASVLRDIRDDFKIAFPHDPDQQKAAGLGLRFDAKNPRELLQDAAAVREMLAAHAGDARVAHVDAAHLHDLGTLAGALRDAMAAHGSLRADRHDASAELAGLVHLLAAQAAHIRLVAKRVFKDDPVKRDRFASRLPHHQVKHREKPPTPTPTPTP